MAELKERLQPSLLDRLTDDEPDKRSESRDKRVLSVYQLRNSVLRDLSWLFNATELAAAQELSDYAEVEQSTLNFGLADLAGKTKSGIDIEQVARSLRRAIWAYEPRLLRRSVRVSFVGDLDQVEHNNLCFRIDAELWAQPVPLRLALRTELDLESGEASIKEVGGVEGG